MSTEQKNKEAEDAVVINTKVTLEAADRLQDCARRMGLKNTYTLMRIVADCILRFADNPAEASDTLISLMRQFEGFKAWQNVTPISAKHKGYQIVKAVYFMTDGAKAPVVEMVEPDKELFPLAGYKSTSNINRILTDIIRATSPNTYVRLTKIGKQERIETLIGVLDLLIGEHYQEDISEIVKEMFSDNERDETGISAVANPSMKHKKRHPKLMEKM